MHGFHKAIQRRLEALERRMASVVEPETAAATARRLVLVRAAVGGFEPEDLQAAERPVFSRIVATLPILQELRDEGALDAYLLDENGDDHPHRDDPHEDGELAWSP